MSQSQQESSEVVRDKMGGSVTHAREMLEAGIRQDDAVQNPHQRSEQSTKAEITAQNSPNRSAPLRTRRLSDSDLRSGYTRDENEDKSSNEDLGDIEAPILPIQGVPTPRRNVGLGPPPSSRRGPSSYYSREPFVSPIPEELNDVTDKKKVSAASSAVIPTSWGSGPPESDILGYYENRSISDSDHSNDSTHQEEPTLVRQASLGKRGKPSLRNINKSQPEATDSAKPATASTRQEFNDARDSGVRYSTRNVLDPRMSSDSKSSDDSSFNSEKDLEKGTMVLEDQDRRRPDPNVAIAAAGPAMSSRIPGSRRPPRLDIDAVRRAESRGSLTSLSDLIRRATRVASNLDRGRTASRIGMLDMFDNTRDPKRPGRRQHSSGTLSDILASFPPPRNDPPDEMPYGNEKSRLREMQTIDQDPQDSEKTPKSGRRCCGMSLPLFIFLCLLAVGLVAAAVIIPVVLVVLPRTHTTPASATSVTPCQQSLPCMNGGVSIANNRTCSCVCANGFSGAQCAVPSDGSCTTISSSMSSNATVGNALPRLLDQAQANFSIPLNETDILGLFNANNVSCTLQNALVTFNGISQKHRRASAAEAVVLDPTITQAPVPYLVRKNGNGLVENAVATTDGIVYDATPTKIQTQESSTQTPTPTHSTTTSAAAAAAAASQEERDLDFASVAVLYILDQTNNITAATVAQSSITSFLLSSPSQNGWYNATNSHMNVTGADIPSSFVLNFADFTITLANGTVVGGKGAAVGNGTLSSA